MTIKRAIGLNRGVDQPAATPTLRDVAAAAGVSAMTVSRVMRGVEVVAAETIVAVRAAVAQLGYRPDPALSALAHRRRRTKRVRAAGSDVVFLDGDGTTYAREVAEALTREAAWFGHVVERVALPVSAEARRSLARRLAHRRVEGLVIGPVAAPLDLRDWDWTRFAAVAVGILAHEPPLHAVGVDYFQGLLTAEAAVRREGGRPGLCLRAELEQRSGGRWRGASLVLEGFPPPLIFADETELRARLRGWARRHRVSVALTVDPRHEPTLRAAGLEVAYLNHDAVPVGAAHLAVQAADLGREAARALHQRLLRREFGVPETPQVVALRARWVPASKRV